MKTRPSADCATDHELLLANFKIKLKRYNKVSKTTKLNVQNIPHSYNVEIKNTFAELELIGREPEELWQEIHQIIREEAKKNIPATTTTKKRTWISEDTLRIAKERREVKTNGNKQLFSKLNAEFQREVRKDKMQQIQNECKKVEEYNEKGKTRDLFKKIKELRGQFAARNGKQLSDAEEIKKRWEEYTEELYKSDFNTTEGLVDDDYELEPDILESEVRWAIQTLANGKTPGQDEIPIELIKELKEDSIKVLTTLCRQIWKTRQWPSEWKKIYIHPDTEEWKCQRLLQLPHNRPNFSCQQNNVEDYTTTTSTFSRTRITRYTSRFPQRKRNT